jgi:hypothetical protein
MNQQLLNQNNGNIIEDDIVNESNIKNISQLIKHIESKLENKIYDIFGLISNNIPNEKTNSVLLKMKERDVNTNFNLEKIRGIEQKQLIINDNVTSNQLRIEKLKQELNEHIIASDKIFKENLTFPGIIGKFSKFKNIREFIINTNEQINNLINFKNKTILEYNIQIKDIINTINQINFQVDQFSKSNLNYFNTSMNDSKKENNEKFDNLTKELNTIKDDYDKYKKNNKEDIKNCLDYQKKVFEKIIKSEFEYSDLSFNEEQEIINKEDYDAKYFKEIFSKIIKQFLCNNKIEIHNEINELKNDILEIKTWKEKEQAKKNKRNRLYNSQEKKSFIISKEKDIPNISNNIIKGISPKKKSLTISKSYSDFHNTLKNSTILSKKHITNNQFKNTISSNKEETKISFFMSTNNNNNNNQDNNINQNIQNKTISNLNNFSTIKNKSPLKNKNQELLIDKNKILYDSSEEKKDISPSFDSFEGKTTEPTVSYDNINQSIFIIKKPEDIQIKDKLKLKTKKEISLLNTRDTRQFKDNNISLWINKTESNNRECNRKKTMNSRKVNINKNIPLNTNTLSNI